MFEPLVKGIRSLSIIGMCKNAGKTTVLNALAEELAPARAALALTSIGRDGETEDIVTHTHKPGIYVRAGTLIATAENMLKRCDITREILQVTPYHTPLGAVVLVRARSDGNVLLAGPSITAQLTELKEAFFTFGAELVLFDGAISRKSLSAPAVSEATILCTGASYSASMEVTLEDTAFAARLLTLPVQTAWDEGALDAQEHKLMLLRGGKTLAVKEHETLADALSKKENAGAEHAYVRGALTDAMVKRLLETGASLKGMEISVEDGTKLLISRARFERLLGRGAKLSVRRGMRLLAVTVNPFSAYGTHYDGEAFMGRMARLTDVPVLNVKRRT